MLFRSTRIDGPVSLRNAILARSDSVLRSFTENLMTYALGRRVDYYDMPTVRGIVRRAGRNNIRFATFVMGIVQSPAFQMRSVQDSTNR